MDQIEELTPQELLLLNRRRLKLTQKECARIYFVSCTTYSRWERGLVKFDTKPIPRIKPAELLPHERCFIYRRRSKMLMKEVASELRMSKLYVNLMELGQVNCDTLLWFWEH